MTIQLPYLKRDDKGWLLYVKVTPNGRQNSVGAPLQDAMGFWYLSLKVTAVPEDGKANRAALKLLSHFLDLPKSSFIVLKGAGSPFKVIKIKDTLGDWRVKLPFLDL